MTNNKCKTWFQISVGRNLNKKIEGEFASVTATEGATVTLDLEKVVKIVPTIENSKATVTYKVSTDSTLTNAIVNVVQLY